MSKKQEIVEIAYKEFIAKGYSATSLADISSKLNITKPALYYHFSSKKDLYLQVVDYYNSRLLQSALVLNKDSVSAKSKLKNLLHNHFELTFPNDNKDKTNQYYFTVDAIHHFPELKEHILGSAQPTVELIKQILTDGITTGEIKSDLDIQAVMFHIGVMVEGLSAISLLVKHIDEDIFNRYYDLFWNHMVQ